MRGYFGLGQLSATEKSDILNQHKSVYNGYQTMQPEVSNTQPLYVYDDISDKDGFVVNNKGEVKKYTNMGINEQVELEEGNMCEQCGGTMKEDVCEQCGSGKMEEETGHLDDIYDEEDLNPTAGFDYIEGPSNDVDTFEGMHKNLYKEQDDFMDYESSYTEDGMDDPDNEDDGFEDMNASEVTDGEMDEIDIKDLIKGKKYKYKTPAHQADIEFGDEHEYHDGGGNMYGFKGGDTGYSLGKKSVEDFISHLDDEELYEQGGNVDDMDDDDVESAYDFESNGPMAGGDTYPVNEDGMYEPMESAWADDELEEGDIYGDPEFTEAGVNSPAYKGPEGYDDSSDSYTDELDEIDVSGVQGIYGAMKKAYDFDSDGPGKAGPYQEFSYESKLDEEDDFEEVDEDIRESFLVQKNKINEMFNRFNKYN
jgi:hypothetical protein